MLAVIDTDRLSRNGQVVSFEYRDAFGRNRLGFVVRHDGDYHAFENLCPHWSTPLDADGPRLYDETTGELICQTHGARFEPTTGECVAGPCFGESLSRLSVELRDGRLIVREAGLQL